MKFTHTLFLSLLVGYTVFGQQWYPGTNYTSVQIGSESNDRIFSDNNDANHYGNGIWFRVHDESVSYKYRDVMLLTESGNVGIGVKPKEKLHLFNGDMMISSGTNTNNIIDKGIRFTTDNTGYYSSINTYRGSASSAIGLQFQTMNGTTTPINALNISPNGNIGIGTTSTSIAKFNLEVGASSGEKLAEFKVSDSEDYLRLINATSVAGQFIPGFQSYRGNDNRQSLYFLATTNTENDNGSNPLMVFDSRQSTKSIENRPLFAWSSYGATKMTLDARGNLGIGTTSPSEKLEVKGYLKVNSGLHSTIRLGQQSNDAIIVDNSTNSTYGGGMFFRVHDESVSYKYRDVMMLGDNGKVGIGITNPSEKLEVNGYLKVNSGLHSTIRLGQQSNDAIIVDNSTNSIYGGGMFFRVHDESVSYKYRDVMMLADNGNVGIGTTDTKGFKLGVNGDIVATKVKVALYNNWPDYVFEDTYELPTLKEVEAHINEKGHLQNVPSAKEVGENGFFLEEMDSKLLQKIEELTLYTIQQEKEIKELQAVKAKNEELESRLAKLEKLLAR